MSKINRSNKKGFLGLSANFWHELKVLVVLIIIALTVKATIVEIYVVPTGSMENEILVGDMLIGNKFIYGLRTPPKIGILWTRIEMGIPWFRLPKFKEVESGDVTIFEFPRDPYQKYVKRCIGVAGDTVSLGMGEIYINNQLMKFPENAKFTKGKIMFPEITQQRIYSYYHGNQDNLEPFIVPYKGMEIDFSKIEDWASIITLLVQDGNTVTLKDKQFTVIDPNELARMKGFLKYKVLGVFKGGSGNNLIRDQMIEQQKYAAKLKSDNQKENKYNPWDQRIHFNESNYDIVFNNLKINGKLIRDMKSYKIKHDYYFFMGDNRDNSYDSRYWGFVPDYQILGTPLFSLINLSKFKLRLKTVS